MLLALLEVQRSTGVSVLTTRILCDRRLPYTVILIQVVAWAVRELLHDVSASGTGVVCVELLKGLVVFNTSTLSTGCPRGR